MRWNLAYALSYRDIEEIMKERGLDVDHSTLNRLEAACRKKKKRVGSRWRLDDECMDAQSRVTQDAVTETYIKVKGEWKHFYRAVDKEGHTIDFLLTAKRDKKAALRYLKKAIDLNGKPRLINIDKSGANTAGITDYNIKNNTRIRTRQCKYLNNIVEQDHRFIKRITRPMLGFKSYCCAQATLAGIELMRMLKKRQMKKIAGDYTSPAELFYALAD